MTHPRSRRFVAPTILAALAFAACTDAGPPAAADGGGAVTDSAGVRIVAHPPTGAPPLDIVDEPVRRLARPDAAGDEDHLFAGVRGVRALAGGAVVAAERDGTLRFFDGSGGLLRRAGGEGDGPGEFRFLSLLVRQPGDTLLAADGRRQRVMRFAPDGAYLDEAIWGGRLPEMPEGASQCFFPNVQAALDDGRLVMWGFQCVTGRGEPGERDYLADVLLVGPDRVTTLARVPILSATEDPGAEDPVMRFRTPAVYGRPALAARGDLALVAIPSLGHRVRGFRPDGSLALDLRDATPEPPMTATVREAVAASWPESLRPMYEGAAWPDRLEGWDALRVMADGSLWARSLHIAVGAQGELWTAFGPDLTTRTRFRFPRGFELHDVRDGVAWGVARDELGVEDVVAHRLPAGG